jgi:hypothetical protein
MNIEFSENINVELKRMMYPISTLLDNRESDIQAVLDRTLLRVNESEEFQCDNAADYNCIFLSKTTIEVLWLMAYAHVKFYDVYCKGHKMDGREYILNNSKWKLSKRMLNWVKNTIEKNELTTFESNNFPKYSCRKDGINIVFQYALLFFISHELFHIKFANKYSTPSIKEEKECDFKATNLILNSFDDKDYLYRAKGVCIGLMYINMIGVYKKYYDGETHPFTYDRLINNLRNHFGKENDKIWKFIVAMFALHLTNAGLVSVEKNISPSKNYQRATLKYKQILEEDINKSMQAKDKQDKKENN